MPKLRQVNAEDITGLEIAQSTLKDCNARERIKRAGATNTLSKFDSLMKSLDGAIRHARRCESTGQRDSDVTR